VEDSADSASSSTHGRGPCCENLFASGSDACGPRRTRGALDALGVSKSSDSASEAEAEAARSVLIFVPALATLELACLETAGASPSVVSGALAWRLITLVDRLGTTSPITNRSSSAVRRRSSSSTAGVGGAASTRLNSNACLISSSSSRFSVSASDSVVSSILSGSPSGFLIGKASFFFLVSLFLIWTLAKASAASDAQSEVRGGRVGPDCETLLLLLGLNVSFGANVEAKAALLTWRLSGLGLGF